MRKNIISLVLAFSFLLTCAVGRVGYIIFSGDYTASTGYNSRTLKIDKIYPTIYDSNMIKLNNNDKRYMAVIRPNEKCLGELERFFSFNEINQIKKELSKGYPLIKEVKNYVPCKYIQVFEATKRTPANADVLLRTSQMYFNEETGNKSINFTVDARGRLLDGDEGTITENNYNTTCGVVLTVNNDIQKIIEESARNMKKGAVVVLDCNTNEILASYSAPNDNINRAFSPYPVGSVFKLIVATAAIESGVNLNYTCSGKIAVGDTTFSCQNDRIHGSENLKIALANSCNTYFVNLALTLGADKILSVAERLGFGGETEFTDEWKISNGNLPTPIELHSKGQLSLFGFGQGSLTATPLQFACAVSAFANGGYDIEPTLISGYVDENGKVTPSPNGKKVKLITDETVKTVREYMRYVVTNGTGKSSDYNNQSAGKTSTAQTGRFVGEKEILNTWFAGFYPYDNPKYSIVVMTEDGVSGTYDCCPIFRTIVEKLDNM